MEQSDYRRVVELVDATLDLDAETRSDFLDRECGDDSALRTEVESLLGEEDTLEGDFIGIPAALQAVDLLADENRRDLHVSDPGAQTERPDSVGSYRVLEELGHGGMGTVYLAEQRDPIERRIALKVIQSFEGDKGTLRFAAECRALARLKHPNIAAIYDAGVADDGRAFVAMEWVEGAHITDWCDQHQLSIRARLELFLGVCAGVGHAHQKGLVHRDLKPSNVLVAEVDGKATAKVIDFGIARTLDEAESSVAEAGTEGSRNIGHSHSLLMGSPIYMSPEAARLSGRSDVDTRTDVYSLGILLYELLVGMPPFETSGLGIGALLHQARTTDPPTLSQRWTTLPNDRREKLAPLRSVTPKALESQLRGDLDAILTTATARERDDRYDAVSDLAADLRRYLQRRPVEARAPSPSYVLSRFLTRNLGAVIAVAVVMGVLIAGVVARTQEARRANQEAEKARQALAEAEQVSDFLIGLFEVADPDRLADDPESVDDLLAKAEVSMDEELADQPLARARFLQTIGRIAMNRTDLDHAATVYEQALALRERHLPPGHPEIITNVGSLGVIYRRQGRFGEAESKLLRAIELSESATVQNPGQLSATITWLANLHYDQKRLQDAIDGHRRALEIRRRELPDNLGALGESLNNLGVALRQLGRQAEAQPILREAEDLFSRALGAKHPLTVGCWLNLAGIEEHLGHWQEAEQLLRRAGNTWQEIHGPTHHRTLLARRALGALWNRWYRTAEAIPHLKTLLALQEAEAEGDRLQIGRTKVQLGRALWQHGDLEEAERTLQGALELYSEVYGSDHAFTNRIRGDLALVVWKSGNQGKATESFEHLVAETLRQRGEHHPVTAWMYYQLGTIQRSRGRLAEAGTALSQALKIHEGLYDGPSRAVARNLFQLGGLRLLQGRLDEGTELQRRAVEMFEIVLPADHPELLAAQTEAAASAS
ncbi:MAG: serine/threonine-protein kinase [Deltaproteobacteria bacterium]|nr:serine/threonine-protein kinase [Deltaproteobacteria bacterium]